MSNDSLERTDEPDATSPVARRDSEANAAASSAQEQPRRTTTLLRRSDQWVVAVLLTIGLSVLSVYWFMELRQRGRYVEFELAPQKTAELVVDINGASWPELTLLPGISETYARRIVEYRKQSGPFRSHEDLLTIPGIGPKTLKKIQPMLRPIPLTNEVADN